MKWAPIACGEDVTDEATLRTLRAAADAEVPRPTAPWSFTWTQLGIAFGLLLLVAALIDRYRKTRQPTPA